MTIFVTGRTFEHRDMLQSMNGWFNRAHRRWEFERLTEAQTERLRNMVGLVVTEQASKPRLSLQDIVNALFADDSSHSPTVQSPNLFGSNVYGDDAQYHDHFAIKQPRAFFGFSSLGKMIEHIRSMPEHFAHDPSRSGWRDNTDFCGSASMAEAIQIARDGWQEGIDRAQSMLDALTAEKPRVRRRKPAVAGGRVNVARLLSGDPLHMVNKTKLPGKKRVTFYVEAGCSGAINPATMIMRAAAIAAMVDLIESVGYSAAIIAVDASVTHKPNGTIINYYQLAVTLKEHGERLNLGDIVFALGHPSFLRRFSFALCSSVPETRDIWIGQGSPCNAFNHDHKPAKNEFYVPVFTLAQQRQLTDDPVSILPFIVPKNFPIKVQSG